MSASTERCQSPALWIAHNYSADVGYAWKNISGLFSSIAAAMKERGCRIIISYAKLGAGSSRISTPYDATFEFDPYRLSLRGAYTVWRTVRAYNVRYAYFTDQSHFGLLYPLLRMCGVRVIVNHSRVSVADPRPAAPEVGWRRLLKRLICSVPMLTPNVTYAVSKFVAQRLRDKGCFPADRIRVIYNGVDPQRFAESCDGARQTTRPVMFVGCRATPEKGVDVLLQACARLRREHPEQAFTLKFAGDGPYWHALRDMARELGLDGTVEFLGEVKDIAPAVQQADVIVVPSNWGDACPSAVLEALMAGKALVATSAGGIPELVEHRQTGLLVPPGDPDALAEALHEVLTDAELRARLGNNARESGHRSFTIARYHRDVIAALLTDLRLGEGPVLESA